MQPHYASRWPITAALLGLLGLAFTAQAQDYNGGTLYNVGSLYHGGSFTNASGASFTNTGSSAVVSYAGPALTNAGAYTATSGATDQFVGPASAAGAQTLDGTVAPGFYNLTLANGASSAFTIANAAGVDVANTLTLNNGITTASTAVAGAIRLADKATVVGTFGNTRYVDGFLSSANAAATNTPVTYPLGATNTNSAGANPATNASAAKGIYSPITFSIPNGTAVRYVAGPTPSPASFATQAGMQLTNVSRFEYYPIGGSSVAPASSTVTLPYGNFGPSSAGLAYVTNPATLTIAGYNGTQWVNLGAASNTYDATAKS